MRFGKIQVVEIPRFNEPDALEIEGLLRNHRIPFKRQLTTTFAEAMFYDREYLFFVPLEYLVNTLDLIKEYFGIGVTANPHFSGACPGCGFEVAQAVDCSHCGLILAGDFTVAMASHPFYIFLKQNGLI